MSVDGFRFRRLSKRAEERFLLGLVPPRAAGPAASAPGAVAVAEEPRNPDGGRQRFAARPGGAVLLGLDPDGQPVTWNLDELHNAFLCAFGASGSGKTVLLRAIAAATPLPCIVVDFHGDLKAKGETFQPLSVGDMSPLEIVSERGPDDQAQRFTDGVNRALPQKLGHVQKAELRHAIEAAYAASGVQAAAKSTWTKTPDVHALIKHVGDAKTPSARGVFAALSTLFGGARGTPVNVPRLIRTGGRCDLTKLPQPAQILAAETLLEQIWAALQQAGPVGGRRYRVLLVVDESAILRGSRILEVLIRESRKFGCALVLASQAPSDLPGAVVNNVAALVQMRLGSDSEARIAARLLQGPQPEEILALTKPGQAYFRAGGQVTALQVLASNAPQRRQGHGAPV